MNRGESVLPRLTIANLILFAFILSAAAVVEKDDSENKIPDSQPEEFNIPYPPTPPKKLITPSNAQKI